MHYRVGFSGLKGLHLEHADIHVNMLDVEQMQCSEGFSSTLFKTENAMLVEGRTLKS